MFHDSALKRTRVAQTVLIFFSLFSFIASMGNATPADQSFSLNCPASPMPSLAALKDGAVSRHELQALSDAGDAPQVISATAVVACAQSVTDSAESVQSALASSLQLPVGMLWHTSESLMALLRSQDPVYQEMSQNQYPLVIGDLATLATRMDWVAQLVKPLLNGDSADEANSEVQLQFGEASLKAKLDFMAGLLQYVVESLRSSHVPLPSGEGVTLVFNLDGVVVGVAPALKESLAQAPPGTSSDPNKDQVGLDHVTVTITNGGFSSGAELNPSDFTINRGHLQLQFHLGLDSITSTTTFTKEQGLTQEELVVTAQLGGVDLIGQATFAKGVQEYKLQASLNPDLAISTSSLWTPEGFVPGISFNLNFCVLSCNK